MAPSLRPSTPSTPAPSDVQGVYWLPEDPCRELILHLTGLRILCPLCAARKIVSVLEMSDTQIDGDGSGITVVGLCIFCPGKRQKGSKGTTGTTGRYHRLRFVYGPRPWAFKDLPVMPIIDHTDKARDPKC